MNMSMRLIVLMAVAMALLLAGCTAAPPQAATATAPADQSAPVADRGNGQPGQPSVAATVNGQIISNDDLLGMLLPSYGMDAVEQLIATAVVDQAAARQNLTISPEEIQAESDTTVRQIAPDLTRAEQQRVLDQLLEQRKITRPQWQMIMRRNAILRKMAEQGVRIDEATLLSEYNRRHGGKAEIRHIQTANLTDAQRILAQLQGGADFAKLASEYSTNTASAADGGLVPPFSRETQGIPQIILTTAFSLKEGQISDILHEGTNFHVIRLERLIPPEDVRFEDVRETLRADLHQAMVTATQSKILSTLISEADVRFVNPVLKEQAALRSQQSKVAP